MDLNDIKAGAYVLVAPFWEEDHSKPGQPLDFTRHRTGATLDLNVEDARRLYAAGAVKLPGEVTETPGASQSVAPGSGDSTAPPVNPADPAQLSVDLGKATIDEVMTWVGDDAGRAEQALDLEEAKASSGGQVRSTLVAALEKILDDAEQGQGGAE